MARCRKAPALWDNPHEGDAMRCVTGGRRRRRRRRITAVVDGASAEPTVRSGSRSHLLAEGRSARVTRAQRAAVPAVCAVLLCVSGCGGESDGEQATVHGSKGTGTAATAAIRGHAGRMSATALRRAASLRGSVFALPSMHAHNPGVIAQGESKTQDSNEDTVALGSVVTRYAFGLSRGHRRAHYDQDPDVNRHVEHPAALVPFETNPEWIAEARKATTETWLGYGSRPDEDQSESGNCAPNQRPTGRTCAFDYQQAIKDLTLNPVQKGGRQLPGTADTNWVWNAPATGGLRLTVFGMGKRSEQWNA